MAEWLKNRAQESVDWNPAANAVSYEYVSESGLIPARNVIDRIRATVSGMPEHPMQAELRNMERWRANGRDQESIKVVYLDEKQWRVLRDFTKFNVQGRAEKSFWDTGRNGDTTWAYSPVQLRGGVAGTKNETDYVGIIDNELRVLRYF